VVASKTAPGTVRVVVVVRLPGTVKAEGILNVTVLAVPVVVIWLAVPRILKLPPPSGTCCPPASPVSPMTAPVAPAPLSDQVADAATNAVRKYAAPAAVLIQIVPMGYLISLAVGALAALITFGG
jgi:hypothetical protein